MEVSTMQVLYEVGVPRIYGDIYNWSTSDKKEKH